MKKQCKRIQELLALEGAGALRSDEAAEEHLVDCGDCLQVLEKMAALEDALALMPARDVAEEVVEKLLQNPALRASELLPNSLPRKQPEPGIWRRWFASTVAAIDWLRATRLRMGVATVPVALFAATFLLFHFTDIGKHYGFEGLTGGQPVRVVKLRAFKSPPPGGMREISKPDTKRVPIPDPTPDEPEPIREDFGDILAMGYTDADDSRFAGVEQDGASAAAGRRQEARKNSGEVDSGISVTASCPLVDVNAPADQPGRDFPAVEEVAITSEILLPPVAKTESGARMQQESKRVAQTRDKEHEVFRRKLASLGLQVNELEKLGEVEEAELLRGQLAELEKGRAKDLQEPVNPRNEAPPTTTVDFALNTDGSRARAFMEERAALDQLVFKEARGYWANTYVPGDRELRRLEARLATRDRSSLERLVGADLQLHDAAGQPPQPFDAPDAAAMAVYLRSDRRGVDARQRLLLEVGLKGTARRSGSRPAMNVGVVLDLRGTLSDEAATSMRALVEALAAAHDLGDRFSLTVAGRPGGVVVPAERFRHGPLSLAMRDLLETDHAVDDGLALDAALIEAIATVSSADGPDTPLGSSVVLLVTAQPLGGISTRLASLAHSSAVAGVPVSVVAVGTGVHLEELDRLVLAGQGNRRLLENAAAAEAVVERELSAVSRVIARALRLRIRLAPGVQLVDVIGSVRLDEHRAQRIRDAENAIDQRLARNLGITADRGLDEEGIQIVIPSFYAEDEHVILLDLVAPGAGPVADVSLRYKDLVCMKNGVSSANLSLGRSIAAPGPLEINVLKNLLARRLGESLERAGSALANGAEGVAVAELAAFRTLLAEMPAVVLGLQGDRDLADNISMLDEYLALLRSGAQQQPDDRSHLVESLRFAGRLQVMSKPFGSSE